MEQRFHNIMTEWGFSKCISHKTFREPSNDYLVNDRCVFGVIKNHGVGECLSPPPPPRMRSSLIISMNGRFLNSQN
ncbi:hypothetical protein RDI58_026856 [Solanum bulbocastanum]|uniref:MATH domain-containing protein n=1 Tax=Solanum bulbocastanum TaxID=147425 RepID=A0AAN8Y191_SOLBU